MRVETFPLLTREQISRNEPPWAGEFGAHTMNHVDLTQVGVEEAWKEITGSKKYLQDLLGKDVKTFAYPYGKVNEAVKELVRKAGFKYGIGTVDGPLSMQEDLLNIRRIVIHPDTGVFRLARKVKGNPYLQEEQSDSFIREVKLLMKKIFFTSLFGT